ncbi:Acyltransferase family protein [Novipirellula aureliae]|uniref:Acyltransferase family protein n=1 Tax=Novipirellula aureliae TaxID=2527966 RepID=A0A5C6E1W1_9BACT|nr:acyltransferase [Novipirellula aureliae]TWU41651.1 Acyltransferase family protein [Novipirellula aureliae]
MTSPNRPAMDPNQIDKPHSRILELDVLRALAAINLVLFHLTHVYDMKFGALQNAGSFALGWEWPFGAYGVELFFILSGFVNSMSLLRRGKPTDFVAARLIRIIPVFLLVIVANLWITQQTPLASTPMSTGQFLANLTLMPKVFGYECIDPVMWTLQIEMMFYVTLVVLFRIGALRRYFWGWGILTILSLLVCPTLDSMATNHDSTAWFQMATSLRLLLLLDFVPLFAIGFLLYMIKTGTGKKWQNILGIAFASFVFHSIDHGKHNPLATLLIISLVTACAYGKLPILRFKPLLYISTISYALYLCHNNLGCVVMYRFNQAGIAPNISLGIAIAFSFSVAIIVTNRIEQPITKFLRARWSRYRSQPTASTHSVELGLIPKQ